MIRYAQGDIFDTPADIRINTVNCVGVMGAGVALAFKNRYPEMFKKYAKACKAGEVRPGKPHVWEKYEFDESVTVVNLPTKDHWRQPSEYEYIEKGLRWLHEFVEKRGKVRVVVPALGCGHGGLDWSRVQKMIEAALGDLTAEIIVFEPSSSHAAGERLDETTLARLDELGIKRLRSGDPGYPDALRGRSGATVYLMGDMEGLSGRVVAVLSSIKPSEREIQGVVACVRELADPSVRVLTGYSAKADRPVIRAALEQGAHVIICLVEGILLFSVRRDLQDVWDEDRVTVISAAKPQQKWYPGGVGKTTAIKLSLADVALVSDPSPKWLSGFVRNGTVGVRNNIFYLDYGGMQEDVKTSLRKLHAKPLGRSRESGKPNVTEVLASLTPTQSRQEASEYIPIAHEQKVDNHQEPVPIEKAEGETSVTYPKRLIEVDLPIKRISAHARREKSIRHGHISTLHIWWARRPLAACRAVICASLWPDPADELCPKEFRNTARELMIKWAKNNPKLLSEDSWPRFVAISKDNSLLDDLVELRSALLDFIADFANWDNSTVPEYLETSRLLTQAAHEAMGGEPGSRPLLVDPFAGGGAIPLEALRLGADAFASDLNPVAVLLNKVVLEYIPKYGQKLAGEIKRWGELIKKEAEKMLSKYYYKGSGDEKPVAYIWARTITCEGPSCGTVVPLLRSLWLKKKGKVTAALKIRVNEQSKKLSIEIVSHPKNKDIQPGTIKLGSVTCPVCGYTTPVKNVREQISKRQGASADAKLLCVVTTNPGEREKVFRLPSKKDLQVIEIAKADVENILTNHDGKYSIIPDEMTPPDGTGSKGGGYRTKKYGIDNFSQFFMPRQLMEHITFIKVLKETYCRMSKEVTPDLAEATTLCLALAIDKQIERDSAFCRWISQNAAVGYTFGRQAIPMLWDFVESPAIYSSGGWTGILNDFVETISFQAESLAGCSPGQAIQMSATESIMPDEAADYFVTDPPYYDSVPYAELSDFFYVWLKRSTNGLNIFSNSEILTPKSQECVVNLNEEKDSSYFQEMMTKALSEARRVINSNGVGIIVFAHKSTSGWEAQLDAMIDAGWVITGSWPIDTERPGRLRALDSAALASSIHLVCRPRKIPDASLHSDSIGDWRDVLTELPKRIHEWMPRLAEEGVVGADAIFACLGPALEIFSRYSSVEKASGEQVTLKEYLEEVWAAVSREALNMIFEGADATGFEEDARLTAMWLWTLRTAVNGNNGADDDSAETKSLPGYTLEYDAARKIAQGLGAHLENLSNLVEVKGDKAMLLAAGARTRYLFGKDTSEAPKGKRKKKVKQMKLDFAGELKEIEEESGDWAGDFKGKAGSTVLDQLHQSMILFAAGRGEAMKRLLVEEGIGRNPLFWRLAQALSALYPAGTDEKRWVDGVLARKKGLGL